MEPTKKLIKFGWDTPNTEFLLEHLSEIEDNMESYDGLGINMNSSSQKIPSESGTYSHPAGSTAMWFHDWKWERSFFEKEIEHLKQANAASRHLKHNFIMTNSGIYKARFDWFDDGLWEVICHNFSLMAGIARETFCKGLQIDLEDYGRGAFQYHSACGYSFAQAWDKARQRGREFARAITREFPDIILFTFFWTDLNFNIADGVSSPYAKAEKSIMGLSLPFMNGVYDVLPETARVIAGNESAGYRATSLIDYHELVATFHQKSKWLLDPENYDKYRRTTQLGISFYLDRYIVTDPKSIYFIGEDAESNLALFKQNLCHTLCFSDEYAWTWGEKRSWYPWVFGGWMKKAADKIERPGPLWEDALPGLRRAMRYAKNPRQFYLQQIQQEKLPENLLRNPGFEKAASSQTDWLPGDCSLVQDGKPWGCWQTPDSNGSFTVVSDRGWNTSNAACMQGVKQGCILQTFPFQHKGAYFIRGKAKVSGTTAQAELSIGWTDDKGRWNFWGHDQHLAFARDLGDGWKEASCLLMMDACPPLAKGFSLKAGMKSAGTPSDVVWVDDLGIYHLKE
ncbi:MAG: hypothetical protein WCT05_09440 [Lentisphaeria bacterium]